MVLFWKSESNHSTVEDEAWIVEKGGPNYTWFSFDENMIFTDWVWSQIRYKKNFI